MNTIPGYDFVEELHRSRSYVVNRIKDKTDGNTYIAKMLSNPSPSSIELGGFRHELRILKDLHIPGVPQVYEVIDKPGTRVLITEDFGGTPLDVYLNNHQTSIRQQLRIAIGIAEVLQRLHSVQLIHKDIKPSNILIRPDTLEVGIIDFSIATSRSIDVIQRNSDLTEGTLQYISPEQTGRLNLTIDHRTDLYSLGVLLYQATTGRLPFLGNDILELVHAHVALVPESPQSIVPAIPGMLSDIIMKLLSKPADDRYRSAAGLLFDLRKCELAYNRNGIIPEFSLGDRDFLTELEIPKKVYARQREIALLTQAFEQSKTQLVRVFIKGDAGVGKSTLVNSLKSVAINRQCYFIEGKFDQFKTGMAYSGILNMLKDLIDQVLREPDDKLEQLAESLKDRLGNNIGLIAELIPRLQLIVGEIPPLTELTAKENENRFRITFREFIQVFTSSEKSITAFIDDVQWADLASLNLLKWLAQNSQEGSLLMIYAYRPKELKINSAFQKWLVDMRMASPDTLEIELGNLSIKDTTELTFDMLQVRDKAEKLADILHANTAGNPFFIKEMLRVIKANQLLVPVQDKKQLDWEIDFDRIAKLEFADNVIDLILSRIERITPNCAGLLEIAACINNRFSLDDLDQLHPDTSRRDLAKWLEEAMQNDLIYPIDDNYKFLSLEGIEVNASFAFIHDRVQQAVYSSLSDSKLTDVHFSLASKALTTEELPLEEAMELSTHVLRSATRFVNSELAIPAAVALVNAAKKAKENNSPQPEYVQQALTFLPANSWETMAELTFGAHLLLAESLFLMGRTEEAEQWYEKTEENATDNYQKAIAICLKMVLFIYSARYQDSIMEGKKAFKLLDYDLVEPTEENIGQAIGGVMQLLGEVGVDNLASLALVEDQRIIVLNNVLSIFLPSAFLLGNSSLWTLSVLEMTKLLLQHGLTVGGSLGLSSFGMIMGSIIGDKKQAYEIGKASLEITEKLNDQSRDAQLKFVLGAFLATWMEENTSIQKLLDSSMYDGLQYGDLPYIGYSFQVKLAVSIYMGVPLGDVLDIIDGHKELIKTLNQPDTLATTNVFELLIKQEHRPNEHEAESFDFNKHTENLLKNKLLQAAGLSLHLHSILSLIHGDYHSVVANNKQLDQLKTSFFSNILLTSQRITYAVSRAILALQDSEEVQKEVLTELQALKVTTEKENQSNNSFFQNAEAALQAMIALLAGGEEEGITHLEKMALVGQETGNYRNAAIASELLCAMFNKKNKTTMARAYLYDALKNYAWYGAFQKVKELRNEMHHLLDEPLQTGDGSLAGTMVFADEHLDYLSIIKSSQVLSAEMDMQKLLREFLFICQQNAGAERGIVLLLEKNKLRVESLFGYKQAQPDYPHQLIRYVQRTGESIASGDAAQDEKLAFDEYFRNKAIRSAIAAPIKYKNKLQGIIYLENNLTRGAFGKSVEEVLTLLSNQIAISLENAILYKNLEESNKNLEQKVRKRTAELSNLYAENEQLLLNMLPFNIAQRLKAGETYISDLHENVSVLFTDIENFTQTSERLSPKELVAEIHDMFKSFDAVITKYGIEKIKTIGDAYLAVSGLKNDGENHAAKMVQVAKELLQIAQEQQTNANSFKIRIGISSGPVVAGVVGEKKFAYDIWGDTVNTAARMEENSEPGKINISGTTHRLIHDVFDCTYRGKITVKNKGSIDMYFVN
jgi:histidine kinase